MATTTDSGPIEQTATEHDGAEVLRHLDLWAEEGLITPQAAVAIREFEATRGEARSRRVAPIIQALLYMGTALTLAALGTIYWQLYDDLGRGARITTPAALALILATAGWFTARRSDLEVRRFGGVLWLLSTGAFAGFLSEWIMPDELAGDWSFMVVGGGAAVWAAALDMVSPQATTQIGLFGTSLATAVGLTMGLTDGFTNEPDIAWLSVPLGLLGVGWIVAGRSPMLRPTALADVLGAGLVVYAPTLLFATNTDQGLPLLLGSILAGGVLGASAWLRSTALLAVGAVALYAYSFRAVWVYFGDTIGMPVVLLIGGLLLLAIAFGAIRLRRRPAM